MAQPSPALLPYGTRVGNTGEAIRLDQIRGGGERGGEWTPPTNDKRAAWGGLLGSRTFTSCGEPKLHFWGGFLFNFYFILLHLFMLPFFFLFFFFFFYVLTLDHEGVWYARNRILSSSQLSMTPQGPWFFFSFHSFFWVSSLSTIAIRNPLPLQLLSGRRTLWSLTQLFRN